MPRLDPRLSAQSDPTGIAVTQDLGGGWMAIYRIGVERPAIDSVIIVPAARGQPPETPAPPTGELTGRMLRQLVPGAAIAHAAASWRSWGAPDPTTFPRHAWLASILGAEWMAKIERLESGATERPDLRRLRLAATAARYAAALQAGDRTPVVTVATQLNLPVTHVRDRLYAARNDGLLESTGRGRAGGGLTPAAQALLELWAGLLVEPPSDDRTVDGVVAVAADADAVPLAVPSEGPHTPSVAATSRQARSSTPSSRLR